jgi:hypothetical protein
MRQQVFDYPQPPEQPYCDNTSIPHSNTSVQYSDVQWCSTYPSNHSNHSSELCSTVAPNSSAFLLQRLVRVFGLLLQIFGTDITRTHTHTHAHEHEQTHTPHWGTHTPHWGTHTHNKCIYVYTYTNNTSDATASRVIGMHAWHIMYFTLTRSLTQSVTGSSGWVSVGCYLQMSACTSLHDSEFAAMARAAAPCTWTYLLTHSLTHLLTHSLAHCTGVCETVVEFLA